MIRHDRRFALRLLVLLGAGMILAPAALAEPYVASPGEMSLGDPKAPVVVVEYASVGCPHCAVWANMVFPAFRAKYVDTGKVRFVFREMITGNGALAAAGFLTARCAEPNRYFQVVDDVFAQQEAIYKEGVDALAKIAEHAGLTRERFNACLQDQAALKALEDRTQADAAAHNVSSTPTFLIGGETLVGERTIEELDQAIARAKSRR